MSSSRRPVVPVPPKAALDTIAACQGTAVEERSYVSTGAGDRRLALNGKHCLNAAQAACRHEWRSPRSNNSRSHSLNRRKTDGSVSDQIAALGETDSARSSTALVARRPARAPPLA